MIIRSPRGESFTVIRNDLINDPNLDWKSLGLLVYLLSKPDNWNISPAHLMKQRKTGKHGVYAILKELCDAGYAERKPNPKGGWDWVIRDNPNTENRNTENRNTENRNTENPTLVNTEYIVKTDNKVKKAMPKNQNFEQVLTPAVFEDELMKECFEWGLKHGHWSKEIIDNIPRFIYLYKLKTPNGIRVQFLRDKEAKTNGTTKKHYPANTKLTPAQQVATACGYSID